MTGNELNVAIALLQQNGFQVGDVQRVERDAPANTVLEQDPAASPPAKQASLDCCLPQLLLLEAEGDADGERRAGQRQGPVYRRAGPPPRSRS